MCTFAGSCYDLLAETMSPAVQYHSFVGAEMKAGVNGKAFVCLPAVVFSPLWGIYFIVKKQIPFPEHIQFIFIALCSLFYDLTKASP